MRSILIALLFLGNGLAAYAKDSDCETRLTRHAQAVAMVQFGFESEYTMDEVDGLMKYYAPADVPEWGKMTVEQRKAWIREQYGNKPEFAANTELHKIGGDPEMAFLPDHLILDATGNLEIVLPPVDSFAVWARQVEAINAKIGVGSMQAMLSSPREHFFAGGPERDLAWFTFTADLDTLTKLESGASRYAKDPTKEVARPFLHQWLGPLPMIKWRSLKEYLEANARGEKFSPEDLKFVKSDASFKYIGGSAYRPDIAGPTRIGVELRSAHKDYALLSAQVQRDMHALASDRAVYERFAGVTAFDSEADYAKLPAEARAMLERLFPAKLDPRFEYSPEETLSNQVYRNFSYPLRGWGKYLDAMEASKATRKAVLVAQGAYVGKLVEISARLSRGEITPAQAAALAQGAVANFAVESGLAQLFRDFQKWIETERGVAQVVAPSRLAIA